LKISDVKREDLENFNLLFSIVNKAEFKMVGGDFKSYQKAFNWVDGLGRSIQGGWEDENKPKPPSAGPTNVKVKNPSK
jgi:hypothetical protein